MKDNKMNLKTAKLILDEYINDIENEEWFDTLDNNDKYTTIIIKHTMEREC